MTGDRAAALVMELYEKSLIPSPADVFDALRTLQREAAGVAKSFRASPLVDGAYYNGVADAADMIAAKIEAL